MANSIAQTANATVQLARRRNVPLVTVNVPSDLLGIKNMHSPQKNISNDDTMTTPESSPDLIETARIWRSKNVVPNIIKRKVSDKDATPVTATSTMTCSNPVNIPKTPKKSYKMHRPTIFRPDPSQCLDEIMTKRRARRRLMTPSDFQKAVTKSSNQNDESEDEFFNNTIIYDDAEKFTNPFCGKKGVLMELKHQLQKFDIYNETKFQYVLKRHPEFAHLVVKCPSNQIEQTKKQMYQVVRETRTYKGYRERMSEIDSPDLLNDNDLCVAMSTMIDILGSIADENYKSIDELCDNIFRILCMDLHKRNAIIFIGDSNSGKSFLADILLCCYEQYELGKFALPPSRTPPQFWLETILGAELYRCEELAVQDQENLQHVKKLLEGNPALEATVKFKNPVPIVRRPVFVTMNGENEHSITRGQSSERNVVKNRAFIYKMNGSLEERTGGNLVKLFDNRFAVVKLLFEKYGSYTPPKPLEDEIDMAKDVCKQFFFK